MFGIKALKFRVKELEERVDNLVQKELCKNGSHKWEMRANGGEPYIICPHCYKQPAKE